MSFRDVLGRGPAEGVPWHEHDGAEISGELVASVIKVIQLLGGTITGKEIIIAGGVDGILRSDNFVAGVSGWRWRGDGSMEAQDGIFRGTLNADDIVAGILTVVRIAAGSITTDKLIVGSFDNLISNPGLETGGFTPHNTVAAGGTWSIVSTDVRSGGSCARYDIIGSTGAPATDLELNGAEGSGIDDHIAVTEGDQIYAEGYVRPTGSGSGERDITLLLVWADELGSLISTTTTTITPANAIYTKITVAGTAPAGVATVNVMARIVFDSGKTRAFYHFDDFYCRRMVATLIIEDQAVDIERMLNPVHADTGESGATNVTITTTPTKHTSFDFTIPSWVGTVHVLAIGLVQISNAAATGKNILSSARIASLDDGSGTQTITATSSTDQSVHVEERNIASPGSTVEIANYASINTGANETANSVNVWASVTGVR